MLPIIGVLGSDRLATLYGIYVADHNLAILMRHRAVLFGILGGLTVYATFQPSIQPLAFVVTFVSVISFLYFALEVGEFNAATRNVVIADVIALVVAVALYLVKPSA
ncbi:MAG: hypothetical protein ACI8Z1_000057 [Candidatus Azotimanducaceae bacterium]